MAVRVIFEGHATVGNLSSHSSNGVERRDSGPGCPQLFGERPLGSENNAQLTRQVLACELLVLTYVRRDHGVDLLRLEQNTQALPIDSTVVRNGGQVLCALFFQGIDEDGRDSTNSEPAGCNASTIKNVGNGLCC